MHVLSSNDFCRNLWPCFLIVSHGSELHHITNFKDEFALHTIWENSSQTARRHMPTPILTGLAVQIKFYIIIKIYTKGTSKVRWYRTPCWWKRCPRRSGSWYIHVCISKKMQPTRHCYIGFSIVGKPSITIMEKCLMQLQISHVYDSYVWYVY
jgi:hypothetical protein